MAGAPPSSSVTPPPPPPTPPSSAPEQQLQYWCHHCNKRVPIETLPDQPDVICFECKNGFVEVISFHAPAREVDGEDPLAFGNEFLQVLRLIAQVAREDDAPLDAAREDDAPPLPPPERRNGGDFLRIHLEGVNSHGDERNHDEEEDNESDRDGSDEDDDDDDDDEDERRRQRRDVIRLRLREFASRALSPRNRILDWAEILMGLEDHSIEFRFQNNDGYIGNPGDYVDAAGYEQLLQTLAETDSKKGAPPASKAAIDALKTVEKSGVSGLSELSEACAICKDKVFNTEEEVVKELPCGHMYHEECIVPWLGSRNTCPVCRFELETDDAEYEEERKKRADGNRNGNGNATVASASSTSSGDGDEV
ncbi:COP1-interacting protein 8 [Artemisia annua]|uniref:RING-type E3 ubiquitin transferase n=1 Tax=Artemisia annua TaxID=35608 RepID=A0A2U1NAE5_ARTAN|nr:COP1-interacting protein 8 [Artemisia annua]